MPLLAELLTPYNIPQRGDGRIVYVGGFYAQWERRGTDLAHIGVGTLEKVLCTEITAEWTEIACHPGYRSPGFASVCLLEREEEIRTLTVPQIRDALTELGITLRS